MIRRKLKNVVKNYSETEILVREATSNESWGPSNSVLIKIAVLSSVDANLIQIMPIVWKRLKDTGKKWRHVYKSLILIEFLITRGNPAVADHCRQNIHFLQSLEQFRYEENNVDVGVRVRKRAQSIVALLTDANLLKNERNKAAVTDMRLSKAIVSQGSNVPIKYGNGIGSLSQGPSIGSFGNTSDTKDYNKEDYVVPTSLLEEDMQLQIALAESQEDANRKKMIDNIESLTDQYKVSLAVQKNIKANEEKLNSEPLTQSQSDSAWLSEVPENSSNDPWKPIDESALALPVISNPWLSNKYESNDPWVIPNDSLSDNFINKPSDNQPWPSIDSRDKSPVESQFSYDSWSDTCNYTHHFPVVSPSISQCVISNNLNSAYSDSAVLGDDPLTTFESHTNNPWITANSNPIPRRKQINTQHINNQSDSVSNFLSNHSHLIDFDNLISIDSLKSSNQPNNSSCTSKNTNPFITDSSSRNTSTKPFNPFLTEDTLNNRQQSPQLDWVSLEPAGIVNSTQTDLKPIKNFNPFLI